MYGTIADWRTYASARGNAAPTDATDEVASQALTRASDYIRTNYVIRFADEYDGTEAEVVESTYIAASIELATPGFFSATYTPSQAKVLTEVKGIKWTVIEGMGGGMVPVSAAIDALLIPLTTSGLYAVYVV